MRPRKNFKRRISILGLFFSFVLCLVVLSLTMGRSQDKPFEQTSQDDFLNRFKKITVSYNKTALPAVLTDLSAQVHLNVVGAPDLKDKTVTLQVKDVTLKEILDLIADQTETAYHVESANLIQVWAMPRVTMNFKNASLEEVCLTIARLAGVSIIISPKVSKAKTTVTSHFENVPWLEALRSVVKTTGFILVQESDKIIRIVTQDQLQSQMEIRIFQLKYLRPPTYIRATIKSDYAETTPPKQATDPTSGFQLIALIKDLLTKDASGKKILGDIDYDPDTNALVVKDVKPVLDKIAEIVKELDVEPEQMVFDVYFITTTNTELYSLGISYGTAGPSGDNQGFRFTSFPQSSIQTRTFPFAFGSNRKTGNAEKVRFTNVIGNVGDPLTAVLRLFRSDTQSQVLQRPSVMALDGHEATIFVGDTIRWAQTSSSSSQSGTLQFSIQEASGSPVNVGFQLLVVPHVIKGTDKIMLSIIPQNSFLTGTTSTIPGFDTFTLNSPTGALSIDLPQIRTASLVTNMIVENNQTIAMGGLITTNASKTVQKVPFFGDIPGLGELFKSRSTTDRREHLLIYLTPHLIQSSEETLAQQRKLMSERSKALQEEIQKMSSSQPSSQDQLKEYLKKRQEKLSQEYEKLKESKGQ